MRTLGGIRLISLVAFALTAATGVAGGQTRVTPGFNLFTVAQDVEIGTQSAREVERTVALVSDPASARYVAALGARLAAQAPGAKYPYRFKIANRSDVNAFALPGGFIYVHRGLLEKVRSEGELAGVMAHEIAHVALRHPTNQASKAYLAQAGVGILGGLLGGKQQTTSGQIMGAIGGLGLNAVFLKYSRSAETQADIVGAQIMARAGYDPMEMVSFFETLRQQAGSDPSRLAQFLSDHPAPANRVERVRQEVALLGPVRSTPTEGNIAALHANLQRLSPPPAAGQLTSAQAAPPPREASAARATGGSFERPSTRFRTFRQRQGFFTIQYPDNWSSYSQSRGYGVTIAPRGGFVQAANGRQKLTCGVVINHYVPFDGTVGRGYRDPLGSLFGSTPLEEATSDLVRELMDIHPNLQPVAGSEKHSMLSGSRSFSVQLEGASPATGAGEHITVVTSLLPDEDVVYMLLVTPPQSSATLAAASARMAKSLRVNLRATHR